MNCLTRRAMIAGAAACLPAAALAEGAAEIRDNIAIAEAQLYTSRPDSRDLAARAKGVLIMPRVIKGGLIIGGSYGEGALKIGGAIDSFYSVAAASIGYQIGVQRTSHALFFMTDAALQGFRAASGWELGADAEFTVPGDGISLNVDSTTIAEPIIALIFSQDGLLLGASLAGAKYSRIVR